MIRILGLGKVKEAYVKELVQEYLQRLSKYEKVEYLDGSVDSVKGFIIALDEKGKEFTSKEFAEYLKKINLEKKNITFVIGEAEGLPENLKYDDKISLSKMTFPNQMVRIIFIEQLYRAFTIIKGEKYHK